MEHRHSGSGPVAPCDRRLLGQALTNLLQNAADAISMRVQREGADAGSPLGKVMLAVQADEDWVWLAVADDGVGLPDGDRSRLTEPYVTHKPKGTGLGLAIVKKIMEDHGGRVTLDERPEGRLYRSARIASPGDFFVVRTAESLEGDKRGLVGLARRWESRTRS